MGRASISYTNKDYESIRAELLARIPQLTDRWTDLNESDLGVVLLELFAGIGDMLAYYIDSQAAEGFLPTARQRQSVINLCKLIGYKLSDPVPARTTLRFTLSAAREDDVVIPKGTVCRAVMDEGDVYFETISDAIIPRGEFGADIEAIQGERKTEDFIGTGLANQVIQLNSTNIAEGSARITISDNLWTNVPSFIESGMDSLHYAVETDGLGVTRIRFGDGYRGRIPYLNETIAASYLETLGDDGNIGRGLVSEIVTSIYAGGEQANLSVTNITPAASGADRESVDHAKLHAPVELSSLWKAVTKADYKALVEGYPGVAKAEIIDANDSGDLRYYQVKIAIAPDGGGMPAPSLLQEVADYIESRKVITIEVNLVSPVYVPASVSAEVYIYRQADPNAVRRRIEEVIGRLFAFDSVSFGMPIHSSRIISAISGVSGVSHVKLILPSDDTAIGQTEIPILGEVTLDIRRVE